MTIYHNYSHTLSHYYFGKPWEKLNRSQWDFINHTWRKDIMKIDCTNITTSDIVSFMKQHKLKLKLIIPPEGL